MVPATSGLWATSVESPKDTVGRDRDWQGNIRMIDRNMPISKNKPLVSVVISFFNEEDVLPELILRLGRSLDTLDLDYELIFVNDASTDGSLSILTEKAEQDKRIKVLNMSRNFGSSRQGVCTIAGIEYASGDAIIFMDADLQDPPELLPQMIDAWRNGDNVDVVYTTRLSRAGESKGKLWLTKWGYRILQWTAEVDVPVNSGDFKLISRRVADHLLLLGEKRPFLRGLVPWVGFKQVPVFYHREPRFAGRTKYWVISPKVINNFLSAIISFSDIPLKICLLTGILISFIAFGLGVYAIACKFLGLAVPGWSGIMAAVLFVGGVELIMLGMVGLYVAAILDQVKDRPRYLVESTIGFDDDQHVGYRDREI